ncbi:NAD(P)/FAD-dependent oxidoreductase [Nocardia uniformis]|uniref:NAD(P)/FAD-dependent oxidoreductase n=1 Tax=Nocardia uniformis TaxID=53432 RepID=A0A849C2E9_9NOCA|nr:FAD-dependent oxidoreductase [Nocardia uniformis]NNH71716.1 NAD(P)/FAD-dependent oxidoreductase [Nocardia uniformis]
MSATPDVDILVIGAGQAGLSVGYHLRRLGMRPEQDFLIVDHSPAPGGAWQFRWPSLTLSTVNRVHDLPGMEFAEALPAGSENAQAATAVPHYFELYEKRFDLRVHRPVSVTVVCDRATPATCPKAAVDGLLHAETGPVDPDNEAAPNVEGGSVAVPNTDDAVGSNADDAAASRTEQAARPASSDIGVGKPRSVLAPDTTLRVRGLINATGTWDKPFIPYYRGAETFAGRQLHAHDYRTAAEFAGKHVVVVGGGITAIQLLDEISQVATTTWATRREPVFRDSQFAPEDGRAAVAIVEDRVRRGLPPGSVVSVTGLINDARVQAARDRGVLNRRPMFDHIEPEGIRWSDGTLQPADVILWCTGFRSALDHLAPLRLRGHGGGITMTGRLATQVAADPRIHLIGYGPSASTIGANRAGRAAAVELTRYLSEQA